MVPAWLVQRSEAVYQRRLGELEREFAVIGPAAKKYKAVQCLIDQFELEDSDVTLIEQMSVKPTSGPFFVDEPVAASVAAASRETSPPRNSTRSSSSTGMGESPSWSPGCKLSPAQKERMAANQAAALAVRANKLKVAAAAAPFVLT